MGDQFNSATQQDLKAGGDGAKQYGWNLFNSIHAAIADANITYPNLLYIQATGASNPTGASFNVPFVYQKIKGDFDVNTAMVSGIPNHHNYGFICRDPNASAGEDWLGLCTYYDDQTYSYNTANSNSSATGLSAVRIYLRIKRAGNVFTTFTSTDGNTWTQHQQYTRTDLAITVQVGMYTPDASGALYDYFLGSYTITPITVKLRLYNRLSLANNYGNYLTSSATEQLPTYLSNPLAAGESAIYCRNAIAAALTALSVKGLSSEIINLFIAHPLTPEYLRHVRLDILEGWRRLLSLPNKIVDSGIETTIYAGSALSDTKRFDIQNTISEGYRTMLYSLTRIVDSGIEASLFIGSSLSSIIDAYTGNTISEGFNKSHYVRSEISDPVNMTLTLRNTLERALALSSYIKVAIDSGPGVKRQSIVWDIRLDGLSIKAAAKGITLTKDEAEAISHIEIELAGLEHYDQCDPAINHERQRIELEMGSVTYRFLLESREMSQIYGSEGMTLWGRQKTGLIASGYADKLTQTYESSYASDIAQAVAGDITLNWETDDYWLKEFSADDYPIDAIIKLASASGGLVETTVDGTLRVRPKYPVAPAALKNAAVDNNFDRDNIISLDINEEAAQYSSVTVMIKRDAQNASNDFSIEAADSCTAPGAVNTVKVYIPNENIAYELLATPEASCVKSGNAISETVKETIVLTGGTGTLSKSLFKLIKYELYSCDAVTEIEYSIGGKEVTATNDTCSVLEIEYETKYDEWSVSCAAEREVALCVVTKDGDGSASAVKVIMGRGLKAAEDINNDLIVTERQAYIVGKEFLSDNYYRKRKYQLEVPYVGCSPGQIAAIADDRSNACGVGIVRKASVEITMNQQTPVIHEKIEIYCYDEDGLL